MDDEDKGFFILVLGVLAAVLTIVSWWAIQDEGDSLTAAPSIAAEAADDADHEDGDDADHEDGDDADHDGDGDADHDGDGDGDGDGDDDHDEDGDGDEPEPTPTAEPEPTPAPEPDDEAAADEGDADDETAGDGAAPPAAAAATVVDLLAGDSNLSAVAGLLTETGLSDELLAEGPFTVLAPSNDAVVGFDADAAARLFGQTSAVDTLTYHVLPGTYTADDLKGLLRGARSGEIETLQGDPITLSLDGDQLVINGNAVVSSADAIAGNGVVHTIENILVPREAALNLIVGLEPIQFASGSAVISAESTATLDQVAEALQTSDVEVAVEGHTDSQGDPATNQALSLERARAVVNYLVANGVDETRLSAEGFGADDPVADNATEEGRALNRRIEFRIDT